MTFTKPFYLLLALMIACGTAVSLGNLDPNVSFESARQLWSDVLRDADDFGLQASRVSAYKEMQFGAQLNAATATWSKENPAATQYVNSVGQQLLPYVHRNAIRYHFHVLESPEVNAFALPGGHVYVFTGMLDFLQSEAELAAVLGHEISHVDLRHCIERYQYEIALKKLTGSDLGEAGRFAHEFVAMGYRQDEEMEADLAGERLAIEAGYDPDAAAGIYSRLAEKFGESRAAQATTPVGEIGQATLDLVVSYFRSHPPSDARARQLSAMTRTNQRELAGRIFYRGTRNYQERIPRSQEEFIQEKHVY